MLTNFRNWLREHDPLHVAGAQLGLVCAGALALAFGAATAGPAQARLDAAVRYLPRTAHARVTPVSTGPLAAAPLAGQDGGSFIRLQDLTPEEARRWNADNPVSRLPNPAARPFHLDAAGVLEEARATDCMTAAIYYEAGAESLDGQRAVAQVVLNRLRHPAFAKTVCGVVFEGAGRRSGCQFTFTCDGSLARTPDAERWASARKVAEAALHGYVMKKVGEATHYHAVYVAPYWSPTLVKVAAIGAHVFYRWTGGAGLPPAFAGEYAGGETQGIRIAALDDLARKSAAVAPTAAQAEQPSDAAPSQSAAPVVEAARAEVATLAVAPTAAALDAHAVVAASDLDWQGRPRDRGPPRLAMPSRGLGF